MWKDNPLIGELMKQGEERISKLATQLLASEGFVSALQGVVQRTLSAKGVLDRSLGAALAAMNLPTRAEVQAIHDRLDELERTMDDLDRQVAERLSPNETATPEAPT